MSTLPDVLWLNVSPALRGFDRSLWALLSQHKAVAQWQYQQLPDEASSLDKALVLLHDYLKFGDRPLHLIGHSTAGLLGLLYARRHPERVASLTLLSVGCYPAVDWQAHYYAQLNLLPCSRTRLLNQMVYNLFGHQSKPVTRELMGVLERDLSESLSPHTLIHRINIAEGGAAVPLLVCAGDHDPVIDPGLMLGWQPWLKPGDSLWRCSGGRYFFHHFYPQAVSDRILQFWSSLPSSSRSQVDVQSFTANVHS